MGDAIVSFRVGSLIKGHWAFWVNVDMACRSSLVFWWWHPAVTIQNVEDQMEVKGEAGWMLGSSLCHAGTACMLKAK